MSLRWTSYVAPKPPTVQEPVNSWWSYRKKFICSRPLRAETGWLPWRCILRFPARSSARTEARCVIADLRSSIIYNTHWHCIRNIAFYTARAKENTFKKRHWCNRILGNRKKPRQSKIYNIFNTLYFLEKKYRIRMILKQQKAEAYWPQYRLFLCM